MVGIIPKIRNIGSMKQECGIIKKREHSECKKRSLEKHITAKFFNSTKILRNNVEERAQKLEQTEKEGKLVR